MVFYMLFYSLLVELTVIGSFSVFALVLLVKFVAVVEFYKPLTTFLITTVELFYGE